MGLNELHTLLRDAVLREDYIEAGRLSDTMLERLHGSTLDQEERKALRRRMSWRGLGAAPWLSERLDALNYTFPTTIQINAMEGVNAILNSTAEELDESSLEARIDRNGAYHDMGIVVTGTTGSGKTLSYLVPLLSTLSDSLFARQRIRVGAEEMVGDTTGDLLDRLAVVTSPVVRSNSRKQTRQKGAIAAGASISTLGKSGKDVKSPLALIVVPTRELGVQTAMLLYQLIGGVIKDDPTQSSGRANMFKYKGPKGIRIGCVLDDEESSFGLKLQTDVAITTPKYLGKLLEDGDILPSKLRVVVYDEADLALEETDAGDLSKLFDDDPEEREYSRLVFLVGASVTESLGNLAVSSRVLPKGKSWIASATDYRPLESQESETLSRLVGKQTASLKDLNLCLYPGLKHERVILKNGRGLLVLARLLRKALYDYEQSVASPSPGMALQRPRVVVFFPDEAQARAAIEPLRDAMWGDHRLCVLLPKSGVNPLTIMEQFKKNETSVMLATPNSVRGLDFPALTHVYTLYLPMEDPREYVHLAGRVGRVGQLGTVQGDGGHVISILKEEDASQMEVLAKELGFDFTDVDASSVEDIVILNAEGKVDETMFDLEKTRRFLEDTLNLVEEAEDPVVDVDAIDAARSQYVYDDEDDDEEEDE